MTCAEAFAMRLPHFNFCEPSTVEEVLSLLEEHQGRALLLAGGTDLVPIMKYGLEAPSVLVGLKKVTGLRGISRADGKIVLGAMTPLAELLSSRIIMDYFPALIEAVKAVAAPPIWNVATVGGNICQHTRCLYYNQSKTWRLEKPPCLKARGDVCHAVPKGKRCFSVYSGDLAPVLIALSSRVTVRSSRHSKTILLQDLFSGNGLSPFTLGGEELLTDLEISLPEKRSGSSYVKMRVRSALDYPLLSAAASMTCGDNGEIEKISLVLGAVGPRPVTATDAEQFFTGRVMDEVDLDALGEIIGKGTQIVDNLSLPGAYRRKMLPVAAREAVTAAFNQSCNRRTGEKII
jgi:4-hydroxybenzoyl-CoA reductase beta subunit